MGSEVKNTSSMAYIEDSNGQEPRITAPQGERCLVPAMDALGAVLGIIYGGKRWPLENNLLTCGVYDVQTSGARCQTSASPSQR